MQGTQAKIVSPTQERAILDYLVTTRYPARDRVMEDVSQVLIPDHRGRPNAHRLMKSPITRSCMCSVLETHSVRRTRRLIRVRRVMCLLSICWVLGFREQRNR